MQIKHWGLIFFSGILWLIMGISLIMRGLRLIVEAVALPESPLLGLLQSYCSSARSAASMLIAIGIILGTIKGRFVLRKAVMRVVERILSMDLPIKLYQIYSPKFYVLIAIMISLSFLMRITSVPGDIRGGIDLAVGSALMNGAFLYFRTSTYVKART